jgi:hypothetical protein
MITNRYAFPSARTASERRDDMIRVYDALRADTTLRVTHARTRDGVYVVSATRAGETVISYQAYAVTTTIHTDGPIPAVLSAAIPAKFS